MLENAADQDHRAREGLKDPLVHRDPRVPEGHLVPLEPLELQGLRVIAVSLV